MSTPPGSKRYGAMRCAYRALRGLLHATAARERRDED
jgi:hypothetical protein